MIYQPIENTGEYTTGTVYSEKYVKGLEQEIERLNNIINELEKWVEHKRFNEGTYCIDCIEVKNKINQLKTGGRQ